MTTSGATSFEFEVLDFVEMGYGIAGVEAQKLGYGHAKRARQLLQAIFGDWQNKHNFPWKMQLLEETLTVDEPEYDLDASIINVLDMVYRESSANADVPMIRIAEGDYLNITNKDDSGQPDRYFLRRDLAAPKAFLWQCPSVAGSKIVFYATTQLYDITASSQTLDMARRWAMAVYKRLGYELMPFVTAMEQRNSAYQNERTVIRNEAVDAFEAAVEENRDTAPTAVYPAEWNQPGLWG